MRRGILIAVGLFVMGLLGYLAVGIMGQLEEKANTVKNAALPAFRFLLPDGSPYTDRDIASDVPLLVKYVNPECDLCREETSELLPRIDAFPPVRILMVLPRDADARAFSLTYRLDDYEPVTVLSEGETSFSELFGNATFPTTLVYGPDRRLIEKIRGRVKTDYLIQLISPARED